MDKIRAGITVLLVFIYLSLAATSFAGVQTLNTPVRITNHPADDFQPAVSPDGRNVAFVSNRSGNNDIWLAPVNGGPARQLTYHTAFDSDPSWCKDGKKLAFTSLREDAKGDIWILDMESRNETRITDSLSAESYPSWLPDCKKIAFSRGNDVWSIDLQTRKEEKLFQGLYPSVSPDGKAIAYISFAAPGLPQSPASADNGFISIYRLADGKSIELTSGEFSDAFPSWSPDGKEIYFSRFSEDTNGDRISDAKDKPSIWKIVFTDSPRLSLFYGVPPVNKGSSFILPVQLTAGASYELFPSGTFGSMVYAVNNGKDFDLYRIPLEGIIPALKSAKEQINLAYLVKEPMQRLLAFRKVYLSALNKDYLLSSEAQYQAAQIYMQMGNKEDASRELKSLMTSFPDGKKYVSLAEIELAKIRADDAIAAGDRDSVIKEISVIKNIIDRYKDQPHSQAMGRLEIGNIYFGLKDDAEALKEYERIREMYPAEADAVAQARLKQADIYSSYGDEAQLTNTYVSIIKDYPASTEWGLTAAMRVLSVTDRIDDERERMSKYREIVSKYRDLPYLPALAQYKAGELYQIRRRFDEAMLEYKKVAENFPSEAVAVNEASIAMAEIELSKGAHTNALTIYEELMKKGDARGKRLFIRASLEKGRADFLGKEPAQAIKSYKGVIDIDYDEVKAHRGLIEAYAMKGEAEKAVALYSEDVHKLPENATAHYSLGLAYTYTATPALAVAESEIKKALSINYSLPFAHQTLGWIYEVRDKTEKGNTMGMAVDEYQAALALLGPDDELQAVDLLLNTGNGYATLGNHEKAYEFYKRRLESGIPFDDKKREAVFYESLGNAASRTGNYKEGAPYYLKALNFAKIEKEKTWEMKITEELGLLHQEAGEYMKASEYFSSALKIAEAEKMDGKKPVLLRNIAYNLYHAGEAEAAIGYFNRSLEALKVKDEVSVRSGGLLTIKKALAIGKEGSEAFMGFEKTGEEKLIYSYLGRAYAETGEYESALDDLLKKLELIPAEGRDTERGILLNNLGFLYYQVGDNENAYRYFNESMDVAKKADNFTGEMVNTINIGLLAAIQGPEGSGQGADAVMLQENGISRIELEKRAKEYIPYLKNNLGLLYLKLGRWQSLSKDNPALLPPVRKIGAVPYLAEINLNSIIKKSMGLIEQERENLKKAAAHFKDGLNLLEEKKEPWLRAVLELNLATSLYSLGADNEASSRLASVMKLSEQNSLNDLKWRGLWLQAGLDSKNRVRHMEDAVAALERTFPTTSSSQGALSGGGSAELLYKELISLLFLKGDLDEAFKFAERMAMQSVKYEASKARYPLPKEEEPLSARDAQWLLDDKTALVRYLVTDAGLLIWIIDSETIQGRQINIPLEELGKRTDDLLLSLEKAEINDRLSAFIISPVSNLLSKKKRLYIVTDPVLSQVPFAALRFGNEFMVDRFEISYVPSAYILNAAYEKRNLNKVNILISQGEGYSEAYVEGIGSRTPIFATLRSDKNKFLDMASNYGMLHITDAFSIGRAAPFKSSFRFNNGKLFLSELTPLNLNPNVAVLTATSVIEQRSAARLSYALQPFIFAGVPTVIVKTLRSDKESEEFFMKEFYEAFRKESASGALTAAQRAAKAKGMRPNIWAGYSLYGYSGMGQEEERKYASRKVADIMNTAIEAYSRGEWKVAIRRFEEGLLFLKTIGAGENLGSIYQALARASANTGEYAKGAYYQEEFVKISAEKLSKPELAASYKTLGILYSKSGESSKAEEMLIEALKLWKGLDSKKSLADGYRTLALLQEKGGGYTEALSSFNSAMVLDHELSDQSSEGQDFWDIGRIYYLRLNRLDDAMKSYGEALAIFTKIVDKEKTASVLLDIGLVYEQEGEYETAKNSYFEAIKIAGKISDRIAYARGTLYLANVAWRTGDYQEALRYQKTALNAAVELKDRKQEAMAHNLAGLTYMNLGMLEKALESLSKSLSISIDTGDRLDTAAAYNNTGIVHRELGNMEKSIENFQSALTIDKELKTDLGMAYDMRNLGISYERMGRLNDALENLQASLSLSKQIGDRSNQAMALYSLGSIYTGIGRSEDASKTLGEAYLISRELNLVEVLWRSLRAQAILSIRRKQPDDAYQKLKEAIIVVEKMRGQIKVDEFKTGFLENKADLYEEMVLLLLGMQRTEEAFNYAERARSRNFIDMLGNQKVNLKSAVNQRLLDSEKGLRGKIERLEERLRTEKDRTGLLRELKKVRSDYETLLTEIKTESPELATFVTVEPPTLPDIQRAIPDGTVLLEYMVTKTGIIVWVVSNNRVESVLVPIERSTLNEKVVRYRELMEKAIPLEKESEEIYTLLIRPVEEALHSAKNIAIIPHDVLHYLSFSSLFDGKKYLMESYPVFYSPSASVMKMVNDRKLSEGAGHSKETQMLVIGNPDLDDSAYDLPFAEKEAVSIVRENEGSKILLGKDATETRTKDEIERFNVVHFASHGVYDSATPLFSTLKLTRDADNDGNFTANEIFSLNLRASLVMMSACQTGLGKLTSGDEIIGLNRAFIYAGTPSIISTLWRVNDAASAMLVKRFYRNYKKYNLAESLRLAQLAVKEYYPHPAYWAGFGLTGKFK